MIFEALDCDRYEFLNVMHKKCMEQIFRCFNLTGHVLVKCSISNLYSVYS